MPDVWETWAAHTASGYYVGNAWEHYRCHEVYISSTKRTCILETIFFHHMYLTMPTIMPADALIKVADNLVDTISGQLPKNSITANTMEQLMEMYKIQANKATCKARAQRVLIEQALAQRVAKERQAEPVQASHQHTPTIFPTFDVEDSQDNNPMAENGLPIISQDEDSLPSVNTRQQNQTRTLMQDYMFHMMKIPGHKALFTPARAASHKYSLQFLCDFASTILVKDTGDLLEHCHHIKHQKYRNTWSQSFGKEIRHLATTTETIFFISKHKIPKDHQGKVRYGRIECDVHDGKKDNHHTRLTMGGNLIYYPGDCGTPMADLFTVKILLTTEQHHFDTKCKNHDNQYQGFLLEYIYGMLRIFPHEALTFSQRCH
jgi:hypothetical protein